MRTPFPDVGACVSKPPPRPPSGLDCYVEQWPHQERNTHIDALHNPNDTWRLVGRFIGYSGQMLRTWVDLSMFWGRLSVRCLIWPGFSGGCHSTRNNAYKLPHHNANLTDD